MNDVEALQNWYSLQCDGSWEHQNGVKIETIDNPGWYVEIALQGTDLDRREFSQFEERRSETDWVSCRINSGKFKGAGGPRNLADILSIFNRFKGQLA